MRYGENPHQKAAFYRDLGDIAGTLPAAKQLHGKELSYNNINDTNGALELLREFDTTAVVAVKPWQPRGVGVANEVSEAYRLAYEADGQRIRRHCRDQRHGGRGDSRADEQDFP